MVNEKLETVLPRGYENLLVYDGGYGVVMESESINNYQNYVYGIVSNDGTVIAPLKYDSISSINNKGYAVFTEEDSVTLRKIGGEAILELDNQYDYRLYDDFIVAETGHRAERKYAVLNFKGELLVPFFTVHDGMFDVKNNNILYKYNGEYYIIRVEVNGAES